METWMIVAIIAIIIVVLIIIWWFFLRPIPPTPDDISSENWQETWRNKQFITDYSGHKIYYSSDLSWAHLPIYWSVCNNTFLYDTSLGDLKRELDQLCD